jgi:uncharacterized membrane protein
MAGFRQRLRRIDRRAGTVYLGIAALLLGALVIVPASGAFHHQPLPALDQGPTVEGTVTQLLSQQPQQTPDGPATLEQYAVRLASGSKRGQTVTVARTRLPHDAFTIHPGDDVVLVQTTGATENGYYIADHVRSDTLVLLTIAFVGMVALIAGIAGMRSLLALVVSLLVILRFIVPGLLAGDSPLLITLLGALIIMVATLYLAHGVSSKTTVALGGTLLSLLLTAVLAAVAIAVARFTGLTSDEASSLQGLTHGVVDPRGLLLSGVVLGTLGMVNDVTVAQASTVFELRRLDPSLRGDDLYGRAMAIGRDHIGSLVYTLTLAYAGAALPLLVLLSAGNEPLGTLLNRELISAELVRTLVGSIGIVACVPITTLLASLVARPLPPEATASAPVAAEP